MSAIGAGCMPCKAQQWSSEPARRALARGSHRDAGMSPPAKPRRPLKSHAVAHDLVVGGDWACAHNNVGTLRHVAGTLARAEGGEIRAQLLEIERLERLALLLGQPVQRTRVGEPLGELFGELQRVDVDILEVGEERLVVGVVQRDVLDAQRAAQLIEPVERAVVQAERHRLHQRHPLVGRHRQLARAQLEQEVDQHG